MKLQMLLVVLAATTSPMLADAQERFTLSGREVAFYNLVGEVRIEPGSGSEVVIEVTRAGRDAGRLRVERGNIDGLPTLRVLFPSDDITVPSMSRGNNTTMRVREDGTFGGDRGRDGERVTLHGRDRGNGDSMEAEANIVVHVPAGVHVHAHLGVGEMVVGAVNGTLDLNAVAANVDMEGTRGEVRVRNASGNIVALRGAGSYDFESASGNVEITGFEGTRVEAEAASGNMRATDVVVSAPLRLESASGNVRVRTVRAPSISATTASGNVEVDAANTPELTASSASGDVRATLIGNTVRRAELSSASGNVTLTLGAGVDAEIEAETGSGGIDIELPITIIRQTRSYLRGRIGQGTGRIMLEASSGNVRVTQAR